MRKVIPLIIWMCLLHANLHSTTVQELTQLLDAIKTGRIIIQNNSTAFLITCKQLESNNIVKDLKVRIVSQSVSVREADLVTAKVLTTIQSGTVLSVLKKEGEWLQVTLPDSRNGWIHQDDAQSFYDEKNQLFNIGETNPEYYYQIRFLAENYFLKFSETFEETELKIIEFEKKFNLLPVDDKRNVSRQYEEMKRELETINIARAYINHYYKKLPPLQVLKKGRSPNSKTIGFNGSASIMFGSSAFESGGKISETTRNISLAGNIIFTPQSKLAVQLNQNKDVIRTPFTSSSVNTTYSYEASSGTRVSTSVYFQDYSDELVRQNNFRNLGAMLNVVHPFNENFRIMGDVQTQSRSYYDTDNGSDFQGVQFNTSLDYMGKKTTVNAGVRGRIQSSDITFLDYHRIIPNLRLTYKTAQNKWSLYGEAEQMAYNTAAESKDYNRIRVDLESSNPKTRTQLTAINWSFPDNEGFNNLKIRILGEISKRLENRISRSTGYLEYTFYTSDLSSSRNYVDLRFDRNFSRKNGYFDIGAFGRYWDGGDMAHRFSVYSRFGFKISGLQIGPVVGADMLIDPVNPDLKQAGNSFRAGVDGRGNFLIHQATIYSSVRYQQTIVYNAMNISEESETRNPVSIEVTTGAKIPVARTFEVRLDLRYYSLDYDIPDIEDPMPVRRQSGLRYLAGISYRF